MDFLVEVNIIISDYKLKMWIEKLKLIGILLIIKKRKIRKTPPSKKKTICCLYKIYSYITQQQPAAHCYKSQRQPGCERYV